MRATQVMAYLQELIAGHGDLDVLVSDSNDLLKTKVIEDFTFTEFVKKGQFSQAFVLRIDEED